jgi:hypothetical protein
VMTGRPERVCLVASGFLAAMPGLNVVRAIRLASQVVDSLEEREGRERDDETS